MERGNSENTTTYEVDIFSKYTGLPIEILYEIMTDSTISDKNVDISRKIIHREGGGEPSQLRQWLFKHGIGKSAFEKAIEHIGLLCPALETANGISRDDVIAAFSKYYIPNNMTLIVVGDFNKSEILDRVRQTFGTMEEKPLPERPQDIPNVGAGGIFQGTMSPIVGSDAGVGVCYPTSGGDTSPDHFGLKVLANYLNDALYNSIRVKYGLSYSPFAFYAGGRTFGLFCALADVDLKDINKAMELINNEISAVATKPPDEDKVEVTKRGMLLQLAQLGESNIEYAT